MKRLTAAIFALSLAAFADVQVVDGVRYECKDGLCRIVEESGDPASAPLQKDAPRIAQGCMSSDDFVAFLENRVTESPLAAKGRWLTLLLVFLGGLALNLTPCVLPMIPVNLIVIGRSAKRGAVYGLGMAVAYGLLGVAAAFGGLAFGDIQGNPWFNAAVALVFVFLALALFGVFFIDFSRFRPVTRSSFLFPVASSLLFPFFMGALSAVLAGACVAPILISVLLLTGKLYAEGHLLAPGLPFVLGLGMALPWPFLGAGLQVLPKPGAWMKQVNRVFGALVLGFAAWYGFLSCQGFFLGRGDSAASEADGVLSPGSEVTPSRRLTATPATLNAQLSTLHAKTAKPILVDCWATWCKNCAAMERVLEDVKVKKALERFSVIRVRAEDISELRKVEGFENVRGLPAFVIFD